MTPATARRVLAAASMLALAGLAVTAQQPLPPSAADLPPAHRGGAIERALAARAWDRAEQLLVAAAEGSPASPELLEVLGSVFLIEQKPLNAAIAFKKADALRPLDDRRRFALVLAYISLERGDWARPELERLAASDPANPLYPYWLGRLDYDAGQHREAIRRFEQVLAREPDSVRAHDNLGLAFEALNLQDEARRHYRRAVELNRRASVKSPWPPLNLGIMLRNDGQLRDAEGLLREAAGYDDGLAQAHYQLGVVLEQDGRLEEALAALTRAAARNPDYAEPQYALARVYRRLGRPADAETALSAFRRLHEAKPAGRGR